MTENNFTNLDVSKLTTSLLFNYQKTWINDRARLKIAKKGRQTGFSFTTMLEAVTNCVEFEDPENWYVLSAGERQAKKMCQTAAKWVKAFDAAYDCLVYDALTNNGNPWTEEDVYCPSIAEKVTTLKITFKNGKEINFLPANADTIRGDRGHYVADEFAFHMHGKAILAAIGPATMHGQCRLILVSSPNGTTGAFYEIWENKTNGWSRHEVTLPDAIADGLPVDLEHVCNLLNNDPELIAQEVYGEFVDSASQFISNELYSFAMTDKAAAPVMFTGSAGPIDDRRGKLVSEAIGKPKPQIAGDLFLEDYEKIKAIIDSLSGELYFGFDVARKRDMTSLWINERVNAEYIKSDLPRAIINLHKVSYDSQWLILQLILNKCRRGAIDATGLGNQLAETAMRHFAGRVEAITFTGPAKEILAWGLRKNLQDTRQKVPNDTDTRNSFKKVKKIVGLSGNDKFVAESDSKGHADEFWACGLAAHAGDQPEMPLDGYIATGRSRYAESGEHGDPRFPSHDMGNLKPNDRTEGF